MRFTVPQDAPGRTSCPRPTGRARSKDPNLPRMGERFRLRKDFDVSGFPPARAGHPEGPQEVRDVRGRQRQRLVDVDRPRPAPPGPRRAAPGEGRGLRGRGHGRPVGRGQTEARSEALRSIGCGEHAWSSHGPAQARLRGRAPRVSSSRPAATWTAARAAALRRAVRLRPEPTPTPPRCSRRRSPTPSCSWCPETLTAVLAPGGPRRAGCPLLLEKPPGRTAAEMRPA